MSANPSEGDAARRTGSLTPERIERYSRQIVVPEVGGHGQERILASRLAIAGEFSDVEPALAYMVGAGVGTIFIHAPDRARADRVVADMAALNPDAKVIPAEDLSDGTDATLILVGSGSALGTARKFSRTPRPSALILARLSEPAMIAVMPKSPPCPACADPGLLAPFTERAETAGFITMIATVEAFKILAGHAPGAPAIIQFDGYESRAVAAVSCAARCPCAGDAGSGQR